MFSLCIIFVVWSICSCLSLNFDRGTLTPIHVLVYSHAYQLTQMQARARHSSSFSALYVNGLQGNLVNIYATSCGCGFNQQVCLCLLITEDLLLLFFLGHLILLSLVSTFIFYSKFFWISILPFQIIGGPEALQISC